MYLVLSQRIDTLSDYNDIVFKHYHFPSKYRSQINIGDRFVYNQGDRMKSEHRYYFGCGVINEIIEDGRGGYYAVIIKAMKFERKVGIHYSKSRYFESVGFSEVRKKEKPPWQSSIRRLSEDAYLQIISQSGGLIKIE